MAFTYGYYDWPITQIAKLLPAAGVFPHITAAHMDELTVPTTKGTILDQSSVGSGVIVWLAQNPTTSHASSYADTWLTVDGSEILTQIRTAPSGNNYIIGKTWEGADEHVAYNFDLVWFKNGFKLEAERGTYASYMNCYWYELDWS